MGVKLDWQIESERVYDRIGEDPKERWKRRRKRFRLILLTIAMFIIVGVIGSAVIIRLETVDNKLKQGLIDAVQAEIATLRIGDRAGYLSAQRSASEYWVRTQSQRFDRYQELKSSGGLELTGNVLDTVIDGQRGRVLIEERVKGVSYYTVWYYWRYSDGWRHVPSDYTFWGEEKTITGPTTTIRYRELDGRLARALGTRIEKWWADGCQNLGCPDNIKLLIEVVSNPSTQTEWQEIDAPIESGSRTLKLILPSPLAIQERVERLPDLPTAYEDELARMIAERQFNLAANNLVPVNTADAAWLRQTIVQWSAGVYTGRGDPSRTGFINSLFNNYGASALRGLVKSLTPAATIRVVATALNLPVESLSLDWRDFFQWRLDVEKTLIMRNEQTAFMALWDTANPRAYQAMLDRAAHPTQTTGQVQAVAVAAGPDGFPLATVQISLEGANQIIFFKLLDGEWKRTV